MEWLINSIYHWWPTWIVGFSVPLTYIIGVKVGRRYATRHVTFEFQKIIQRLLHFAGQQDYKSLHLMLHDLVAEEDAEVPVIPQTVKEEDPNLSTDIRDLTKEIKPSDREDAEKAIKDATSDKKEQTD